MQTAGRKGLLISKILSSLRGITEKPGDPLTELVREKYGHGVPDLRVFWHIPVENLLRGITGAPAPSRGPGAFEHVPIRECLKAGPFADGRYAWLAIMNKVIR